MWGRVLMPKQNLSGVLRYGVVWAKKGNVRPRTAKKGLCKATAKPRKAKHGLGKARPNKASAKQVKGVFLGWAV